MRGWGHNVSSSLRGPRHGLAFSLHEVKYDGYRLRLERNGDRVRRISDQ
jgi:ATP-dependent DNA ligase